MKKKLLITLVSLLTVAVCVIGFSACDENKSNNHTHSMTRHAAIAATCTENGSVEYWSCSECGKNFADADGKEEIKDIIIPAFGHDWGAWKETKTATCEYEGERERICSICGAKDKEITARVAHVLEERAAVPATCTAAGNSAYWECTECGRYFMDKDAETEIEDKQSVILPPEHSFEDVWSYDDVGHWHGCLRCDERSDYAVHDINGGKCSICGFEKGTEGLEYKLVEMGEAYEVAGMGTATSAHIVIPSVYNGKPVIGLGTSAFANKTGFESISIPSSVKYMGESVFRSSSLTSIYITDIKAWCEIGRSLWSGIVYDLYLNGEPVIDLVLPDDVTVIKSYAFFDCGSIANVTLGENVLTIGQYAFGNCYGLTAYCDAVSRPEGWSDKWTDGAVVWDRINNDKTQSGVRFITVDGVKYSINNSGIAYVHRQSTALSGIVSVKSSVECDGTTYSVYSIKGDAFSYCRHITELNIGSIKLIDGMGAFLGCVSLERVSLPGSLKEIPSETFAMCSSLKSIYIPSGVSKIGVNAFTDCTSLSSAVLANSGTWYVNAPGSSKEIRVITSVPSGNAIMLSKQYCQYYWYCK